MAGGGIKINNIKVSGGADGKTPKLKIEDGQLYYSFDNWTTSYSLGQVKGEKGDKGDKGDRGEQGIQGIQGIQGEQGIQGIQGEQGEIGNIKTVTEVPNTDTVGEIGDLVKYTYEEDYEYYTIKRAELYQLTSIQPDGYHWDRIADTYDIAWLSGSKQNTLVSGENIKTINGKSILGSGDLTIEGGGSVDLTEVGELIDTKIERVYLEGEGAPTTATQGELGQLYSDTTNGNVYQLKSIVDGVYTWVKLINEKDVATNTKRGLMTLYDGGQQGYGIAIRNGGIYLNPARNVNIDSRAVLENPSGALIGLLSRFGAITPATIDYAVKRVLIDNKLETALEGAYAWTDEEKATARANLGIGDGKLYLHEMEFIGTNSLRFASMAILSTVKDACYTYDTINDLLNNSIAIIRWGIGVKDGAPNPKFASLHKGGEIPTYVYGGFGFVRNKGDVLYNGTPIQFISASREAEDQSWEKEEYIKFIELNLADIAGEYANTDNYLVTNYTATEWTSF